MSIPYQQSDISSIITRGVNTQAILGFQIGLDRGLGLVNDANELFSQYKELELYLFTLNLYTLGNITNPITDEQRDQIIERIISLDRSILSGSWPYISSLGSCDISTLLNSNGFYATNFSTDPDNYDDGD